MNKFYFFLWLNWSKQLSVNTIILSIVITFLITFITYIKLGLVELDAKNIEALLDIYKFYFSIVFSVSLLFILSRSIKYIFNVCICGYELKLLSCDKTNVIESIGYGDLVKVWRKWFMLLIWLVAICMIVTLFNFFNIYALFIFILLSGYLSFIILISRCKKVKVVRC